MSDNTLGTRWKQQRERMGKTQSDFAVLLGVSTSYVSLLESGQRKRPCVDLIKKAAEVTGRSFKYMAGE